MQLYNTQHAYNLLQNTRYGVLHRISPTTFLQLKIQLETARFEPLTFRSLTRYQLSCPDWINKLKLKLNRCFKPFKTKNMSNRFSNTIWSEKQGRIRQLGESVVVSVVVLIFGRGEVAAAAALVRIATTA